MPRHAMRPSAVMTTREAAIYVGLAESTLEKMRNYPAMDGPVFVQLGKAIRYRVADLDKWLADRVTKPARRRRRGK